MSLKADDRVAYLLEFLLLYECLETCQAKEAVASIVFWFYSSHRYSKVQNMSFPIKSCLDIRSTYSATSTIDPVLILVTDIPSRI
jgi:hypothetical protein